MSDLGFPPDSIGVVAGIYSNVATRVVLHRATRLTTGPIAVGRGTIQGDTLSPLIFLLYIEPLLRWLNTGSRGYTPRFHTPDTTSSDVDPQLEANGPCYSALAFADDLAALTSSTADLLVQFNKITSYCSWGGLSLNPTKCAVTGALHRHVLTGLAATLTDQTSLLAAQLDGKFIAKGIPVPFYPPSKPYKYLGVWLSMTLDFSFHFTSLVHDILEKGRQLVESRVSARQSLHIINRVLKPKITYCFPIAPFSETDLEYLDGILVKVTKICMGLKTSFPNKAVLTPTCRGGVGLHSLLVEYTQVATLTLTRALNDPGDLGLLTRRMLLDQQAAGGHLPAPLRCRDRSHFSHPLALRLLSIMHSAKIFLHCPPSGIAPLLGTDLWQTLSTSPLPCPISSSELAPLWRLGITSLGSLTTSVLGNPHMIDSETLLSAFRGRIKTRHLNSARIALNKLTLFLNGTTEGLSHYTRVSPLTLPQRRITIAHNFIHLPQPNRPFLGLSSLAARFPFPVDPAAPIVLPRVQRVLDLSSLSPPTRHPPPPYPVPVPATATQPLLAVIPTLNQPGPLPPGVPSAIDPPAGSCDGSAAFSRLVPHPEGPVTPADALLCDRLVTFSTTPVHPDFDVYPTGDYAIQIGLRLPLVTTALVPAIQSHQRAFVYRPDGTCSGSLSVARLSWLRQNYNICCHTDPNLHARHTRGTFEKDLAALFCRYPQHSSSSVSPPPNSGWCLPESLCLPLGDHLSAASHRFASPLDVSLSATSFFSRFPQDTLFGARHDAYSVPWTGSSVAHPPFHSDSILKSLRWAVASCNRADVPSFTVMIIPAWPRSSFSSWLQHPTVKATCRIPKNNFPFSPECSSPTAHVPEVAALCNTQWPIQLIIVANDAGMAQYGTRQHLNTFTASAGPAFLLRPLSRPPSPLSSPWLLWGPPNGFRKLLTCPSPAPIPPLHTSDNNDISLPLIYPPSSTVRWPSTTAYYTDGACKQNPDWGAVLGASFYLPSSDITYLIKPGGTRETKTIMRAELAAIYAALLHILQRRPSVKAASIFTDSLASIYLIQRVLRAPSTLLENKHFPLLRRIRLLLLTGARSGVLVHFQKVKSHIGISGNEAADVGAALALAADPRTCHYNFTNLDINYLASLPAWPCVKHSPHPPNPFSPTPLPDTNVDGIQPSHRAGGLFFLSNITTAVSSFIIYFCPERTDGSKPGTPMYDRQQQLNSISLPALSNIMWQSCPYKLVKNILQIRYQLLWTGSKALQISRPYKTTAGVSVDGLCHICPPSHTHARAPDTAGHILGSCRHPELKACYITRHNKALVRIHSAFLQGSKASSMMILDATSRKKLPEGIYHNRIPQWMLPSVPPTILDALRPDILLLDGFPLTEAPPLSVPNLSPAHLRRIQQRCTLIIVELGYTLEPLYSDRLTEKRQQHLYLITLLRTAGWNIAFNLADLDYVHFVILGTAGTIFCNAHSTLVSLGIFPSQVRSVLSSLHTHAVQSAFSIITLRRRLESSVFSFDTISPEQPPDPP